MTHEQKVFYGFTAMVVIGIIALGTHAIQVTKENGKQHNAYADSLRTYKDALGRERAQRLEIQESAKNVNDLLASRNEEIKRLMKADKKTITVTHVETVTRDSIIERPYFVDTSRHIIKSKGGDKWFQYEAIATPDSFKLAHITKNEFVMRQDRVKNGTELTITNLNPYTSVKEMVTYRIPDPPQKKFNVSLSVGYGATPNGLKPFVGVTVGKTLIRF